MLKKITICIIAIFINGFFFTTETISATTYEVVVNTQDKAIQDNILDDTQMKRIQSSSLKQIKTFSGKDSWALINLLSSGITILLGYALIFTNYQKQNSQDSKEVALKKQRYHNRMIYACLFVALISIASFFLTESIYHSMILYDQWTMLMIIFPFIQVLLYLHTRDINNTRNINSFEL